MLKFDWGMTAIGPEIPAYMPRQTILAMQSWVLLHLVEPVFMEVAVISLLTLTNLHFQQDISMAMCWCIPETFW